VPLSAPAASSPQAAAPSTTRPTRGKSGATVAIKRAAGFVTVSLRLPERRTVRIVLIGPKPNCVTARTLIRHAHAGLNRFRLRPTDVRGLKAGVYLVRIAVRERPKPLHAAVTITRDRRVLPNRRRSVIDRMCAGIAPAFSVTGTSPAQAAPYRPSPAPPHAHATHHRRFDLIPGSIRKAVRGATAGVGRAAAVTASSPIALAMFFVLVACGGALLAYPLARHLRQRHARRYG
jgi:hypothetical protein